MFETIYSQVGLAAAVLVLGFVFWKGDEPERLAGAAYAMVFLAATMIKDGGTLSLPRWGVMGMDVVLLAVYLGLGWQTRRTWIFWASACQAIIVTGHILVATNLRPPSNAFAAMNNMANYGLLIAMAVGTFWAWQERRALEEMNPAARTGPRQ
ncbi:MAG: hypothetical protein EON90_01715 [Brevundimonas sp.]|nr:MAG: hypothetical protein EON90_01715 [Brevundimonas sp.]